jgi:putative transposase
MAKRGNTVSDETDREWCLNLGGVCTKRIGSRSSRSVDRWHMDKVLLKVAGRLQYL